MSNRERGVLKLNAAATLALYSLIFGARLTCVSARITTHPQHYPQQFQMPTHCSFS
jgi:hypothetical protein